MNENKTNINWYPGHIAKTRREIKENIDLVDLVFELVDARMPLSSKIIDIDDLIKDKPKVLIMTKYDLCDKLETDKIIKYYEDIGYKVVAMDLINDNNISKLLSVTEELMQDINKRRIDKGLEKRAVRVLVVGVPNVGKSTLINKLVGKNVTGVANTPGFTKTLSWIRINKDIELLDTPGILWPRFDNQEQAHILAAFSSIKEDILNIDDIAVFILKKLNELYPEFLKNRYGIDKMSDDIVEVYDIIGKRRGALSKGGVIDYEKVSNIIINDLKNAYIGKVTFDRI